MDSHLSFSQSQLDGLQTLPQQTGLLLCGGWLGTVQQGVEELGVFAPQRLQTLHDGLGVEDDLILAQSLQGLFTRIHHGGHRLLSYTLKDKQHREWTHLLLMAVKNDDEEEIKPRNQSISCCSSSEFS